MKTQKTNLSGSDWDGRFSNMVISESSYPELFAQLAVIPSRMRAERLRVLATIGLSVMTGQQSPLNIPLAEMVAGSDNNPDATGTRLSSVKSNLKNKLRASVSPTT